MKFEPSNYKVCHLSTVHNADDSRVFHKECKTIAASGFQTSLIIPHPISETIDGVRIIPLKRIKTRILRAAILSWQLFFKALNANADVYHFHDPEIMPVAIALRICGKRLVMDVHDDIVDFMANKKYIPKVLHTPVGYFFRGVQIVTTKFLHGIVAATPEIATKFPKGKTITVQNFPRIDLFDKIDCAPYQDRKNVAIHCGLMHENSGFSSLMSVSKLIPSNVRIEIAGRLYPNNLAKKIDLNSMLPDRTFKSEMSVDPYSMTLGR